MLRNLFASSSIVNSSKYAFADYLQPLPLGSSKVFGMLAVLLLPITALGWWCYSFVLSVGAMAPLQSTGTSTSSMTIPERVTSSEANINSSISSTAAPNASSDSSSVDVNISNDFSQTTVNVNGQSLPISDEGTTHKVIQNDNGQTTVDVSIDSDTTGTTSSRSSTNINLRSSSSSDVDIRSREIR